MNFFTGSLIDYFKERRLGGVFFVSLVAVLGIGSTGGLIFKIAADEGWLDYWREIVPATVLLVSFLLWRGLRGRLGRRCCDRYQSTPLSQDEWTKARRKLSAKSMVNGR